MSANDVPKREGRRTARCESVPGHGRSKAGTWWTHELVAYGLNRFHCAYLRTPTVRELRSGVDDLPSYATIKRLYGTAGRMLTFHGYRVRAPGGQHGRRRALLRDHAGRFLPLDRTADSRLPPAT